MTNFGLRRLLRLLRKRPRPAGGPVRRRPGVWPFGVMVSPAGGGASLTLPPGLSMAA